MPKKKTKEEFIKDARKKHGDKYDYSKVEYVNSATKVCIICPEPEHGEFWQTPSNHLKDRGCPKCKVDKIRERLTSTKEDFIKKAKKIHGDKYDYSKADYVNSKTKVCIICHEHGEFWQEANSHLSGCGCSKCSGKYAPTTEEWIASARKVHDNKYDYSKVKYINANTKVCIICPEHREFWQRPADHTIGIGCPKCSGNYVPSTKEWIEKAHKVHGDKYDYSKVKYIDAHTKICIICPDHGEFWQTPNNHLSNRGCSKCSCKYVPTTEEWVMFARKKHGDKYDYSKVRYVNGKTKVCIICHEHGHGDFWQEANSHLSGCGCPKCANETVGERCRSSKEEFIKKANKVHKNKYDYSKVQYIGAHTKVCIKCPEHGEFWQTPHNHTQGQGCFKCGIKNSREKNTLTKEEFIKKARKVHGDKYDYSKVKYVNARTKVCIICPKHGEFWQNPADHLSGKGCQTCNLSHLERSVMNYLDEVGITYDYQKRFDWLSKQSLDFYLPDYNVGIECQGEQHFFPVEYFGGDKTFKNTLERDKRKKALCEEHGIKLLYFGNTPNYDTFLGDVVHDDVQYIIEYLNEYEKKK